MSLLADTSGILVILDADHALHQEARLLLERERLIVPSSILCEVDYMAATRLGGMTARAFLEDVVSGAFSLLQVELADIQRGLELMAQYDDADIGFVDASVMALIERYGLSRLLTLDRRHFGMFRPKGIDYLELLP